MWDVRDVGCSGCGMLGMRDVGDVGCSRRGMLGMWDVQDVGCSGCGMFGMWDVRDVGCGMFAGMWDVDLQNACRMLQTNSSLSKLKEKQIYQLGTDNDKVI